MKLFGNAPSTSLAPARKKRILLCDDDVRSSQTLSFALQSAGFDPVHYLNGQLAVDALKRDPDFDLVLCDIMMPVLDGFGVLEAVRADPVLSQIPFIFLTGVAARQSMERATALGAKEYLIKSHATLSQIVEIVNTYAI